jgi:hypothetical protein
MKRGIGILLGVCLASMGVYAQEKPTTELTDPVEILKKVDAAAKAVKAVKYKATFKGLEESAAQLPEVEGTVVISGWTGGGPEKFLYDAKVKRPGSSEVRQITAGGDGEEFFVIDHANKTAYVDIDPAVLGRTGRTAAALLTAEFVHPTPFSDELNGQKQELKGSKTIGGEDCYEIHVVYAGAGGEALWHFSKKDFLPRARRDLLAAPGGQRRSQQRILMDVVVDPKFEKDPFKFKLPEGYTKTDDFAP